MVSNAMPGSNPPMGWTRLMHEQTQSAGGTVKTTTLFLCPTCSDQLDDWMVQPPAQRAR